MPGLTRARRHPTALILASLTLTTLAACGPEIRFSDQVDDYFDLEHSQRYDDRLHSPYVAGSSFEIYAYDLSEKHDLDGWTIVSLDPEILEVTEVTVIRDDLEPNDDNDVETDVIVASVEAIGTGTATLEVRDASGDSERVTQVEVTQPDRVVLRAAGPLFIESDAVPTLVDATPKILANGKATFLVEWFAGERELSGFGALAMSSDNPNAYNLLTLGEHLRERREWAQLEFGSPEPGEEIASVEFRANGLAVESFEFELVQPGDIDTIEIVGKNESGAKERELLAVLARAFDLNHESIWGVAFDWDIDGYSEVEEGDLFRYWFEREAASTLGAQYGEARGEITISGDEGFVESSNDTPSEGSCFCSAHHDEPARGLGFGLLSLAALGLVRRQRSC